MEEHGLGFVNEGHGAGYGCKWCRLWVQMLQRQSSNCSLKLSSSPKLLGGRSDQTTYFRKIAPD